MPFEEGPYLIAAFVCERVLEEKDGVKSVVRIVDRVTHTTTSPKMEPFLLPLTLFIGFKSGFSRGPLPFEIRFMKPSGEGFPPFKTQLNFEGDEDRGIDVVTNVTFPIEMAGLYWFEIYLAEKFMTKTPLRVIVMTQPI